MIYSNFYARFYAFRQEVALAFATLWRFNSSRFYFGLAVIIQASAWLQAAYIYRHLSGDLLVIHYNIDFGIDLVGAPWRIFLYPAYGLAVFALNWIIASALYRRQHFRLFANVFSLLTGLALMFVYLINFR